MRGDHFFWLDVSAKCETDSTWNVTILITFLTFNMESFNHLFIFSNHFILFGVMVDSEHILQGQKTF